MDETRSGGGPARPSALLVSVVCALLLTSGCGAISEWVSRDDSPVTSGSVRDTAQAAGAVPLTAAEIETLTELRSISAADARLVAELAAKWDDARLRDLAVATAGWAADLEAVAERLRVFAPDPGTPERGADPRSGAGLASQEAATRISEDVLRATVTRTRDALRGAGETPAKGTYRAILDAATAVQRG